MTFAPEHIPALLVLGLIGGTLSGLLGIGSGIVMIPVLVHLAYTQKEAQGMALAVMVPMALAGALRYIHHPSVTVSAKAVAVLAAAAVVGSLLGSTLAIHASNELLRKLFAILIIGVGFRMLAT